MARSYEQHCALAHALDLVGERWSLLIVRELLTGPKRYTDLADGLVSVPPNVLADRLKQMEANGLIERRRLPPPAASVIVYELTELGEGLNAAVVEFARWGMRTLPPTRGRRHFRPHWLAIALQAALDPKQFTDVEESYEFRIGEDDVVHLDVSSGEARVGIGPAKTGAAVVVSADADTFLALAGGAITPPEAIERGAVLDGDASAIERMQAMLPPPVLTAAEPRPREGAPT